MQPTVGRIVHFRLVENERVRNNQGEIAPAIITRVWSDTCVNLRVFLDGQENMWKTSVILGEGEGNWFWPEIKK